METGERKQEGKEGASGRTHGFPEGPRQVAWEKGHGSLHQAVRADAGLMALGLHQDRCLLPPPQSSI